MAEIQNGGLKVAILLRIAAIAAVLLCVGCAAETHEELFAEAGRFAAVGTPAAQAQAALSSAGFDCRKGGYANRPDIDVSCGREQSLFLAGCSQHLYLIFDTQKAHVARTEVTGPYCAGP